MKKFVVNIVLAIVVLFLAYEVYESIMEPVKYRKDTLAREKIIINKLDEIKTLQIEFRKLNGRYTSSFDTLINFYEDGRMPLVLKNGVVPDTLTEEKALQMGIITRDTTYIPIKDTLLKNVENLNIKNLAIVPFTKGKVKFEMQASTVTRANFKVPVFEVKCYKKDYLAGIKEQDLLQNDLKIMKEDDKFPGLILGSLTEPSTDGNW